MYVEDQLPFLNGGAAEEWLRRIALGRPLHDVPDAIGFTLVSVGFIQRMPEGRFAATEAGKEYLTARGIPTRPRYARRR